MDAMIKIRLKSGREKAVKQGHPWLFSGAIDREEGPREAALAQVEDARGKVLGIGFHSAKSQIRVRFLARADGEVDRAYFLGRLKAARDLRRLVISADTTGYRVLNAEGDGVPGWTIDRYGDVMVSQITSAGLEKLRGEAYAALRQLYPGVTILQSNDLPARKKEGLAKGNEIIHGRALDGEDALDVEFTESGLKFTADMGPGQKTGFYCDQRENRQRVERLAGGRSVLDLFAHSGAFGLYALRGGATSVVAIESSERLIERGRDLARRNKMADSAITWSRGNVFEDLRQREERYGLVLCDPPPLVTRKSHQTPGARAYKDLNRLALRRVEPGGFFFTFSCSAAVDPRLFRQILFSAALEAEVELSLLGPLGASADHPVAVTHPQGEYLKGWWGIVR